MLVKSYYKKVVQQKQSCNTVGIGIGLHLIKPAVHTPDDRWRYNTTNFIWKVPFIFRGNSSTGATQPRRSGVVSSEHLMSLPEKPQTGLCDHVRTGTADIAVKMDVRETYMIQYLQLCISSTQEEQIWN